MNLTLEPDDVAVLRTILTDRLPDLRMEIGGTDDFDTRQVLHRREEALKRIIAAIEQQQAAPAAIAAEPHQREPRFVQRPGD